MEYLKIVKTDSEYQSSSKGDKVYYSEESKKVFCKGKVPPSNEIWYVSTDGKAIDLSNSPLGTESLLESNTYINGKGIIKLKNIRELHRT